MIKLLILEGKMKQGGIGVYDNSHTTILEDTKHDGRKNKKKHSKEFSQGKTFDTFRETF